MRTVNDFDINNDITESCEQLKPYDLFPGLSRSNEVYFGREAPLPLIIKRHVSKIKDMLMIENAAGKTLEKDVINGIYKELQALANEIKTEINCEYLEMFFDASNSTNAGAFSTWMGAEYIITRKDPDKPGEKAKTFLSYDKISDLEDIVITPTGYKYKTPTGKFLCIALNIGLFRNKNVEEITGTILHELGHCFQDNIIGVYKHVADVAFSSLIDEQMDRFKPIRVGKISSGMAMIVAFIFLPFRLAANIRHKMKLNLFKKVYDKINSKPTLKMNELQQDYADQDDKDNAMMVSDPGCRSVFSILAEYGTVVGSDAKKKYFEKISDDAKEKLATLKLYPLPSERKEYKNTRFFLVNIFRSINTNIATMGTNMLYTLSMADANMAKIRNETFLQRYEYFADIFASAYGYGAEEYAGTLMSEVDVLNMFFKHEAVGLNRFGLGKAMYLNSRYKTIKRVGMNDSHGTAVDRIANIYTMLTREIEVNKTLTTKQKQEILATLGAIEEANKVIVQDQVENKGFWRKYYSELIQARLDNKTLGKTEKELLEPIEKVAIECLKSK